MPGIPSSKGCENCRRRKKGCDLRRPCGRCVHLGIKCGNFGRGPKFVNETERVSEKWKPSDPVRGNISPDAAHLNAYGGFAMPLYVAADSLARSGRQSKAIGDFWNAYAPNASGLLAANASTMISERWLQTALGEAHRDPALNTALQSLAFSRASRVTADEDIQRQASLAYNTTVTNIRKALDHPQRRFDDSVLAAVMVLGTFEIHEGSQLRAPAWIAHVDGASKLIAVRGMRNSASNFAKDLYFGHLMNELINAIGSRNRTRKTHPVPPLPTWSSSSPARATEIALFRILNRIPAIIELADSIKLLEDESSILVSTESLTRRSREVMDDLDAWQSSLASQQGAIHHHIPSKLCAALPENSPERIFPTMITFPSLLTAYLLTTLWSCLLLLHSTLFLTYRHIHNHHPGVRLDTISTPPQHTTSACHDLAILIAQSLEYFAQPGMGLVGAQQVGFPTSVALGYFSFFNSREVWWFRVIFRRLRELNVGIEGFLESMFKEQGLKLMIP